MTHAIARPETRTHGPLYWRGIRARDQADVTLRRRDAATWPGEGEARAAVERLAPELWRMGYRVVEVDG
jgi:hypothetical protein